MRLLWGVLEFHSSIVIPHLPDQTAAKISRQLSSSGSHSCRPRNVLTTPNLKKQNTLYLNLSLKEWNGFSFLKLNHEIVNFLKHYRFVIINKSSQIWIPFIGRGHLDPNDNTHKRKSTGVCANEQSSKTYISLQQLIGSYSSLSSGRRVSMRQTSLMPSHPFRSVSQVNEVTGPHLSFLHCRHLDPMWNINKLNRLPNTVVSSRWNCL